MQLSERQSMKSKTNRELNSLIFNTYDTHVNNTSKIVINQNSLEQVKNSYR